MEPTFTDIRTIANFVAQHIESRHKHNSRFFYYKGVRYETYTRAFSSELRTIIRNPQNEIEYFNRPARVTTRGLIIDELKKNL